MEHKTLASASWEEGDYSQASQKIELAKLKDRTDWLNMCNELEDRISGDAFWVDALAKAAKMLGMDVLYNDLRTLNGNLKVYKATVNRIGTAANKQRFKESQQSTTNMFNAVMAMSGLKDLPEDFPRSKE